MLGGRGRGYSKENQVLVRTPCEECGNRLELGQSQIKFLSLAFPARPGTCKSQREPLALPLSSRCMYQLGGCRGRGGPQVLSQGGSSVPSTRGKGGISSQGLRLITWTTYSSLHPEENPIPSVPSSPSFPPHPSSYSGSQPRALEVADCRVEPRDGGFWEGAQRESCSIHQ